MQNFEYPHTIFVSTTSQKVPARLNIPKSNFKIAQVLKFFFQKSELYDKNP